MKQIYGRRTVLFYCRGLHNCNKANF